MCRSIKRLRNAEAPATPEEIRAAALQFVRKISGFQAPSKANREAFDDAVEGITAVSSNLLASIEGRGQNRVSEPCSTTSKTPA
jgi:hypothetical protein